MFKFLKDKLKSWTEKVAQAPQEEIKEEVKKFPDSNIKSTPSGGWLGEEGGVIESGNFRKQKEIEEKEKEIKELKKKVEKKKEVLEKKERKIKEIEVSEFEEETPRKIVVHEEEIEDDEKKGFFTKIKESVSKVASSKTKISENEFSVYAEELEELLLENNVAYEVAEKIISSLKEKIVGKELLRKEIEGEIFDAFKDIIREILIEPFDIEKKIRSLSLSEKPYIILFCGVNGTGKTTSIAKIAERLKKESITSALAAGDTFRAASIEQLKFHGEKLGIPVIAHEYGHDPASVAYDAVLYAKKHKIDAVLIDTAGRMHSNKNLMKEIEKVVKVVKPHLKIFVGESITGNDAIEQAKSFNWHVGIDGIILSKADIDEKGGTALSVGYVTKKPILFLGTGQDYGSIEVFDKEKFIERLGL